MSARSEPDRTCVGCRTKGPRSDLVRLVRTPGSLVLVDTIGRAPGRGAYLHPDPECIRQSVRTRSLRRALRTSLDDAQTARLMQEVLAVRGDAQ